MSVFIAIVVMVLVICGPMIWLAASYKKKDPNMQCLAFENLDKLQEVQSLLYKANIHCSLNLSSPSQQAMMKLGTTTRSYNELWVRRVDVAQVKSLIKDKFRFEEIETAILVKAQ